MYTVTLAVPGCDIAAATTVPVNSVALTNFVVMSAPFHRTLEVDTKPDPFTLKLKPALPAPIEPGVRLLITGPELLTTNAWAGDRPPPGVGLETVTLILAAPARSAGRIVALSCVALT